MVGLQREFHVVTVLACRPAKDLRGGGGFTSGSSGWDWYDGRNLAAAGPLVVVTANYRLGPLGYLYLPDLGIENLGSQDQAAVLGWVERNVAAFGGDPGTVTVGGQSAGAFSALYLALSPVTGPHVTRVITQSGPWGLPPQDPGEAAGHARRFLEILGLNTTLDLAALRAIPAGQLLAAVGGRARRAHAAHPGGRNRAGSMGSLAALQDSSQPRLRRQPLLVSCAPGRRLDGLVR